MQDSAQPATGRLMRARRGATFQVTVDIRSGSPTLGKWFGLEVSADNKNQVWAQYGFTPGFCSLTDDSEVQYKCTAAYNPQGESGIHFADPEIGIRWPIEPSARYLTSDKDRRAQTLAHWLQSPLSANIACQTEVSKKP
jgi:dTDP-4-dehydrorhamnose 3,5-epimerase